MPAHALPAGPEARAQRRAARHRRFRRQFIPGLIMVLLVTAIRALLHTIGW
jgi:uncharacterized membrane protein YdbT with pleckstrin-like domain